MVTTMLMVGRGWDVVVEPCVYRRCRYHLLCRMIRWLLSRPSLSCLVKDIWEMKRCPI